MMAKSWPKQEPRLTGLQKPEYFQVLVTKTVRRVTGPSLVRIFFVNHPGHVQSAIKRDTIDCSHATRIMEISRPDCLSATSLVWPWTTDGPQASLA